MPSQSESRLSVSLPAAPSAARVAGFQPGSSRPNEASATPQKPSQWVQGFAEGRAAAEKDLKAGLQSAEGALKKAATELQRRFEAEIKAIEPQVIDLALAIARSVLGKEIERGNYDLPAIVSGVLAGLRGEQGPVTVRLHPADHAAVGQSLAAGSGSEMKVVADPSVPRASCAVETGYGKVVREVDALLAEIERTLGQGQPKPAESKP